MNSRQVDSLLPTTNSTRGRTGWLSRPKGLLIPVVVGAITAVIAGAGIAAATNPPGTGPVVGACVGTASGAVRLVQTSASCVSSEHPLSWQRQGIHYRGLYSTTTKYHVNDVVSYNSQSWIRFAQGTTYGWQLLARQGATGAKGDTGPPGLRGEYAGPNPSTVIQSGWYDNDLALSNQSSPLPMAAMTIQNPGSYVVFAKLNAWDDTQSGTVTCRLQADQDTDTVLTYIDTSFDWQSVSFNLVHTFTTSSNRVYIYCDASMDNASIRDMKITAIRVDSLSNSPLP